MSHVISMQIIAFAALLCSLGAAPISALASSDSAAAASSGYPSTRYLDRTAFLARGPAPARAGAPPEFRPHGDLRADIYRHLQDHERAAQTRQAPRKSPPSGASRRAAPR